MSSKSFWSISRLLISLIVAVPMMTVLVSLLVPGDTAWQHLQQHLLAEYIINTLILMLLVGVLSMLIGVSTAWLVATTEFPGKRLLSWALMLPMAAPAYIVAYIYTDLLDYSGPVQTGLRYLTGWEDYWFPEIRSLPGAAVVLSLVLYPYIYLLARAAFLFRSATLFDAARTLGASPWRAFYRIALPAARPAIVAGLALVLMETLADFGVVDYFAVPTFSTGIFRTWFALGDKAAAVKLAAFMFLLVIALVALEKYSRRGTVQTLHANHRSMNVMLAGWRAALITVYCALPVVLGSLIPIALLLYYATTVGDPKLGFEFSHFIFNSLQVALITVILCLLFAVLLSYSNRVAPNEISRSATQIATLGYALPGAMLAVGLLAPISELDKWLADALAAHFNWHSGLLLTGTTAILIYAYVVRFLTVAFNSINTGLEQISPLYDQAARSLKATPFVVLKKVHFPLLRPSLIAAAMLVLVDTLRELPATLLLRPFNFETLATRVYRLASDERLAEASTASLVLVLAGLIPVLLLSYLSNKTIKL